jgi:23S rRNA (uracil1939-C5)-methyltransferase
MKSKYPILTDVKIEALAAEGKAITHIDGKVCFVPFAAPEDVVDIQITNKRKSFFEGRIVNFHKKGEMRIDAQCSHFSICGGCKLQHIPYQEQLKLKQQSVSDNLQRIGKVDVGEMLPIIASENQFVYRNKLEYTFSNRRWFVEKNDTISENDNNALGFHIPGMFDRVLDIDHCYLQPEPSNKIRLFIKNFALEHCMTFYDVKQHTGILRNVMIRNNSFGDVMLLLAVADINEDVFALLDALKNAFPEITSLQYVVNQKFNDTVNDLDIICFSGKNHIVEVLHCDENDKSKTLKFKINAKSFFQTNTKQCETLYSKAKEFADLQGNEIVYDLYTGCGTIAQFIADKAQKVIGIEYVEDAIEDAKENADVNNITNCEFFAGDMSKVLTDSFMQEHGKPDVIITDPPRAGMNPDVVEEILKIAPDKIVYISCNSATQARDIDMLKTIYDVEKSQAVDMFPQTHHIENIVLLRKKI